MISKPKLLIVADTYYPKVDGTLRFIEEFMRRAHEEFSISLLVPDLGTRPASTYPVTFLRPSRIFSLSGYPNLQFSTHNFRLLKQAIQNTECVFVQGPGLISYFAIWYAHKYDKKCVVYTHVIPWEAFPTFFSKVLQPLVRFFFLRISVLCYNRAHRLLIPYKDLQVVYNSKGVRTPMYIAKLGIDIVRFKPVIDKIAAKKKVGIDPTKFVVGYVGRISSEKNIEILLDAFSKLNQPEELVLLLVGDGSLHQKRLLEFPANCVVTGFVSNVQDYLQAMDIFVMPSLTETTSLATLEAMSVGLPVLATKVGFIAHYINKDHNGVFFPASNSTFLAAKLEKLRTQPNTRAYLGNNARRTIVYSYSWERSINRIKRLIKEAYYNPN